MQSKESFVFLKVTSSQSFIYFLLHFISIVLQLLLPPTAYTKLKFVLLKNCNNLLNHFQLPNVSPQIAFWPSCNKLLNRFAKGSAGGR